MEQEIKIIVPKGKKAIQGIDKDGNIIITYVDAEPIRSKSWKEFCKNHPTFENEYYINSNSIVSQTDGFRGATCSNLLQSREDAEGILALIQLTRLHDEWVGDWKIYNNGRYYSITHDRVNLENFVIKYCNFRLLSFPTERMAQEFLDCFRDLIEKAKRFI